VASASRLRVYVPKESCLITFLLSGINAPRTARIGPNGQQIGSDEPFAVQAMNFTRYKCLQHDVIFFSQFVLYFNIIGSNRG